MTLLSHFRRFRRPLLLASALLFVVSGSVGLAQPASPGRGKVALGVVTGAVDPGSGEFIKSAISRAQKAEYEALVIQLDTPGGLVSVTREIVQDMLEARIPVVVFVAPSAARAGSAGVFITLAAHVAAMAPTTNIGAAHPVGLGGGSGRENDEGEGRSDEQIMAEKMVNDLSAFIEAIATERGRNVEWAISAVRNSESIPAEKALDLNVIDLIATDLQDLLQKIDGKEVHLGPARSPKVLNTADAEVEELAWALRHRFLHIIGDPTLASILLSLGALGVLLELYNPGTLVPGIAGLIALLLGVIGMAALPVNIGAAVLLILGIGLFAAEVFVSAYGLMGVAGAICFAAGGVLLVDNTGDNFMADPDFGVSPQAFIPTAILIAMVAVGVGYQAVRAFRLKPIVGDTGLIGQKGTANSALEPGKIGKVWVAGELWNAVSETPIPEGAELRVLKVEGLTLHVEPAED